MFICASVIAQQLLMSPCPCVVFDSVAMLPSALTSLFEPIGGGFQLAEACDLQNSLASLQAVCDSLPGSAKSNRHVLHLRNTDMPAARLSKRTDEYGLVSYPTHKGKERGEYAFTHTVSACTHTPGSQCCYFVVRCSV